MKTFNIAYSADVNVASLLSTLNTQGTVIYHLETLRVVGLEVSDETTSSVLETIPGVILVELDLGATVTSHAEWHQLRLVSATLPMKQVYNPSHHGEGVIVYLMDSGVDTTHPEFTGSNIVNLYSYNEDFSDLNGHGTAVASLIVGDTLGVSNQAILKSVKIPFGSTSIGQLLTAFDVVLSDHLLTPGVKVVNCSWGVAKSALLDSKVTELQNAGLVVVAAAGNSGISADSLSPVGLNTVLGVAASDAYDRVISWGDGQSSNYGPDVDITAPGIDVNVANVSGGYTELSGTSLSAAITSAVVAQYVNGNSTLTAQQIQTMVLDSSAENILFRNETIYGSTPNRLLKTLFLRGLLIWDQPIGTMFPVQRGVTTTLALSTVADLSNALYDDYSSPGVIHKKLPWINSSYSDKNLTLTITPDSEVTVGFYSLMIQAVDKEGVTYYSRFKVGVYETNLSELDTVETEYYLTVNENNETQIAVTPFPGTFCVTNNDCPKGEYCCNYVCGAYAC